MKQFKIKWDDGYSIHWREKIYECYTMEEAVATFKAEHPNKEIKQNFCYKS